MGNLRCGQADSCRKSAFKIAPFDLQLFRTAGQGAAKAYLRLFRHPFADQKPVRFLHMFPYRPIDMGAARADGCGCGNAAKGDHGCIRGAAADIHRHRPCGFKHRQPCPHGGCKGFIQKKHLPCSCFLRRFRQGTPLHIRHTQRQAQHKTDSHSTHFSSECLFDKKTQHIRRHVIIRYNAVPKRIHHMDTAGRTPHKLQGFPAESKRFPVAAGSDSRRTRFTQHDALPLYCDQRIDRSKVHSHRAHQVFGKIQAHKKHLPHSLSHRNNGKYCLMPCAIYRFVLYYTIV